MYLIINGAQYTCSRRYRPKGKDEVKYFGVTPEPEEISGEVALYRDDGFLMCTDSTDSYERREFSGSTLTLSNEPIPEPVEQDTTPTAEEQLRADVDYIAIMTGVEL